MPCPIWGTPAESINKTGDFDIWDSPISGSTTAQVTQLTDHAKKLLTTWLCEQRRAGVEVPRVNEDILQLIKSRKQLPVYQRRTAALLFLGQNIQNLGERLTLGDERGAVTLRCIAETESTNAREVYELFKMLKDTGYVEGALSTSGAMNVCPTAGGWNEIDSLNKPQSDSAQVFVAMWFDEATNDAYTLGIAPALSATGYKPIRIDKKEHINKIDDEIIAEIRRSRFLVADFTCEPNHVRGGVYYEAGFAQGLGIPVIWTCKVTSIGDLHFDTRQYAHIVWKTPEDLFTQLKNRIGATIGDGPIPKQ
jgi:hypothetical protein